MLAANDPLDPESWRKGYREGHRDALDEIQPVIVEDDDDDGDDDSEEEEVEQA
jgi:hypothetical protein